MSTDGQGTKCCRKIAENYNRLSRLHQRYRQTTERRTGDSVSSRSLKANPTERVQALIDIWRSAL